MSCIFQLAVKFMSSERLNELHKKVMDNSINEEEEQEYLDLLQEEEGE
jgi:hypothetical protein